MLRVETGDHLAGRRVASLSEPGKATVVAIDRQGTASIPTEDTTFQAGDVAHIIVARDAIEALRERLAPEQH